MQKKQKMRKTSWTNLLGRVFLLAFFVVVMYLVAQVNRMKAPDYAYETVISYTYTDSIRADGFVLFEETFVEGDSSNLGYLVEEGTRVSAGQPIAERYDDETQRTMRNQFEQVNEELALLANSENATGMIVNRLVSQRNTAVYQLLEQLDRNAWTQTPSSQDDFLLAQNKLQILTGVEQDFSQRMDALVGTSNHLVSSLTGLSTVRAPAQGYFVSCHTAQFLPYTQEQLLALSIADFADTVQTADANTQMDKIGKVVSSYTWHFVGVCSIEEQGRFTIGDTLSLAFPDTTDAVFSATVAAVEVDSESGLLRVTLSCEQMSAEVLSLGQECAEIIFTSYEGLRVPTQAVRMQEVNVVSTKEDGTQESRTDYLEGVYVAYNGLAKFRQIEKLYETEDYILVPFASESDISKVQLYDKVIISSVDLMDGKLL